MAAAARALWQSIAELFRFYASTTNWREFYDPEYEEDTPRFALPADASMLIANCAEMMQVGRVPMLIEGVRGRGRTPPTRAEKQDIAIAAAYIRAARAGYVDDRRPTITVREAFGVSRNTLSNWVRDAREFDRDDWAHPSEIREMFERAAARYRQAGRSASAVTRRYGKRTPK